jgi:hypothetical protein
MKLVIASTVGFLLALLMNQFETIHLAVTSTHPEIPHWLDQRYLFLAACGSLSWRLPRQCCSRPPFLARRRAGRPRSSQTETRPGRHIIRMPPCVWGCANRRPKR